MKKDAEQAAKDAEVVNAAFVTAFENRRRRQSLSGVEFVRWLGFDDIADEMEATRRAAGETTDSPQG